MKPLRMRNAAFLLLALLTAVAASAATDRERGNAAAQSVINQWGTDEKLSKKAMEPMASDKDMTSVDGTNNFGVQMQCPGSQRFMRLTLFPSAQNDLSQLAVDLDSNFDGASDQSALLSGPFAAICINGLVQCPAGTISGCSYYRWKADGTNITLDRNRKAGGPNTQADLGGCYCINNACGAGLLTRNSEKVLNDLGTGIALAMQESVPRLAVSGTKMVDPLSAEYYGQQGGCGSDQQPEQYFKNTGAMAAAGQAIADDPNSSYAKLLAAPNAQGHQTSTQSCRITRQFTMEEYWNADALTFAFSHDGGVESCGTGCYRVTVGLPGNNYLRASCGVHTDTATVTVNSPELVTSARLVQASYDDWLRVRINSGIVWNVDGGWTYEGARCGENGRRGTQYPAMDVTGYFTGTPAGAPLELRVDTSWNDKGEGWAVFEIQTKADCRVSGETIDNLCTAQESNSDCALKDETVDTVQTYRGYSRTGLSPLPSTRPVSYNSCTKYVTRDYFEKQRVYTCPAGELPYDGEAARKRYESVHSTFNTTDGTYTDTRKSGDSWTSSAEQIHNLPPPEPVESCVRMCRTRKPRPGIAVGDMGAASARNNTGPAWDYTYRQCGSDDSCPLEAGEDIASPCDCRNNFGEAAAMMQTIRQTQQDMLCQ